MWWLLRKIKAAKKVIKNESPSIIISFLFGISSIIGIALLGTKIPFIVSERTNPLEIRPKLFWRFLRRVAYKRADKIVVQFDNFRRFDNDKYFYKTVAIPNPVLKPHVLKECNGEDGIIRIISLGNLRPIKGFDKLIRAFAIVSESYSNVELAIFGEGSERGNLEKVISTLNLKGIVKLKGYTNNIYKELVNSDIYVMSSEQEGFPNSLSEALAVGLPAVTFQCHDGLQELIEDGKNGYLVEPGNIEQLAEKIIELIEDKNKRHEFSKNARKISGKFSLDRIYGLWEQLIMDSVN